MATEAARWQSVAATMFVAATACNVLFEWASRRAVTLLSLFAVVFGCALTWAIPGAVGWGPESRLFQETGWISHPPSLTLLKITPLIAGGPALRLGAVLRKRQRRSLEATSL